MNRTTGVVLGLATLSLSIPAGAGPRSRGGSPPIVIAGGEDGAGLGRAVLGSLDADAVDYLREHQNGIVEYGLTPPEYYSPAPGQFPRPASVVAGLFLGEHALDLGITQALADMPWSSTEVRCDGSQVVVYGQLVHDIPVESSYLRVTVRDERVVYFEARFISDPNRLVYCAPSLEPGQTLRRIAFVPEAGQTSIRVEVIEQLTGEARVQTTLDACTNAVVSWVTVYR